MYIDMNICANQKGYQITSFVCNLPWKKKLNFQFSNSLHFHLCINTPFKNTFIEPMANNIDYDGITGNQIDDILDGIDDEKKEKDLIDWERVKKSIINNNLSYIQSLISANRVNVDEQEAETGKTLLIYCTICGNFDMVRKLCVFGADISIKDKFKYKALDYAEKYGYYRIAELLYFSALSSTVGGDLKEKAELMFDKRQQTTFLLKHIDTR